ncbi:4a-hydroxytetrahydrobiopterin dehydratase [Nakamurella antarctica]|uniref:Putative pterin-4-alpha-carbinolamine dehydratase n=1 Tax=Nakamurella antarctica TaxID=1902245 RepID=A0A3G8ZR18_9ACTN|nr:4a-hydroxytetrahydrobiopterin dehydratase [Nakamurella antarctica]AZI57004.1 4a-hydroxytetrahydrobiopterin dehydratase [Nakamurella antarctica]
METPHKLTSTELADALATLEGWETDGSALTVTYSLATSVAAVLFIVQVGQISEELNHHPDLDWRYNKVLLRITTHDAGGVVTELDRKLAGSISACASQFNAKPAN